METKEKNKLKEKKEFYEYLKGLGLEPKLDKELVIQKEEKTARENMQRILNRYNKESKNKNNKKISEDAEQKVLKAEKSNNSVKREEFDRRKVMINHLKETFK